MNPLERVEYQVASVAKLPADSRHLEHRVWCRDRLQSSLKVFKKLPDAEKLPAQRDVRLDRREAHDRFLWRTDRNIVPRQESREILHDTRRLVTSYCGTPKFKHLGNVWVHDNLLH